MALDNVFDPALQQAMQRYQQTVGGIAAPLPSAFGPMQVDASAYAPMQSGTPWDIIHGAVQQRRYAQALQEAEMNKQNYLVQQQQYEQKRKAAEFGLAQGLQREAADRELEQQNALRDAKKKAEIETSEQQGKIVRKFLGAKKVDVSGYTDFELGSMSSPMLQSLLPEKPTRGGAGKAPAPSAAQEGGGLTGKSTILRTMEHFYNPSAGQLKTDIQPAFGQYAGSDYMPDWAVTHTLGSGQATQDMLNSYKSFRDMLLFENLAEAKAKAGQSFGSMQVAEWDKFKSLAGALNRQNSPEREAEILGEIYSILSTAEARGSGGQQQTGQEGGTLADKIRAEKERRKANRGG